MKKLLLNLFVLGGVIISYNVLAVTDDFEDDYVMPPGEEKQEVTVPDNETGISEEKYQEYEAALQEAMQKGDPDMAAQLAEQEEEQPDNNDQQPKELQGKKELPFPLLDKSLDRDQDGLSDADEIRLGTEPRNPDTDGDTYIDGIEIIRGYNPKKAGPGDEIKYQKPSTKPDNRYKITGLRLSGQNNDQVLTVTGLAPKNSVVKILIFSQEPKVWTTRTDKTGRFLYNSADTLTNGEHSAYVVSAAADGKAKHSSKPLTFKRTKDALIKIDTSPSPTPESVVPSADDKKPFFDQTTLIVAGAIAVISLLVAITVVWIRRRKKKKAMSTPS